jgi:1,2-diacylglycerol 3-beta-galactosyltransferase
MAHIALLYSDTGGGHRTAAEAIEQAIVAQSGGSHRVTLSNSISYLPFPFNRSEATYAGTMRRAPWLHRLSYRALDGDGRRRFIGKWAMALDGRRVIAFEGDMRADVYVSCQPHFNPFMPRALRATGSRARYMHVVTDLRDVHAFHFTPVADLVIVPNDEVRAQAMRHGLVPDRLAIAGYPILPDFVDRLRAGPETRRALGLAAGEPVLLLMGGGEGMGELYATAAGLMRSSLRAQLIVICGRNAALKAALDALDAAMPTRVLGFVDNVAELMGASDIVITKAGTGSLCEALAAGLPIIIYDAVPGQEDGNRDFMIDHGAAVFRPTHDGVLAQVAGWLDDPAALARAGAASARVARPHAAAEIARMILAHLEP